MTSIDDLEHEHTWKGAGSAMLICPSCDTAKPIDEVIKLERKDAEAILYAKLLSDHVFKKSAHDEIYAKLTTQTGWRPKSTQGLLL